jgi:hypothetical protein
MKKYFFIIAILFFCATSFAQKIPLLPFLKWHTNNAPDCKNVILTKDSIVLPVKNKCRTEGQLENWRPSVDISEGLKFKVPVGAKVQLTITYKFIPVGDDIFRFGGMFSSNTNNTEDQVNGSLRTAENEEHVLPPSIDYTTKSLLVTFSDNADQPIFKAPKSVNGELVFDFGVTYNANGNQLNQGEGNGQTHLGSKAIIKMVKLEVIK